MNNRPSLSPTSSDVINSYKKRRKRNNPNLVYIIAGVLLLGGVILLIVWMSQPGKPIAQLFATETPTPTQTFTPTNTAIPSSTPTLTETPSITPTATFSQPFTYTVQDGDYLALIVEKFGLGDNGIALILLLNPSYTDADGNPQGIDPTGSIRPGQVILLPNPGMQLPTATPIPPDLPRGTKIDYVVQAGDSLGAIAAKFNSTEEEIKKANPTIDEAGNIFIGQLLVIPVNIVTPTATRPPTSTPITPGPGTILPTATFTPINGGPAATP